MGWTETKYSISQKFCEPTNRTQLVQAHTFTKSDWTLLKSTSITNKIRFAIAQNSRNLSLSLCFSFSHSFSLLHFHSLSDFICSAGRLSSSLVPFPQPFFSVTSIAKLLAVFRDFPSFVHSDSLQFQHFLRSFWTPSLQNHAHTKSSKLYQIHFRLCSLSLSLALLSISLCRSLSLPSVFFYFISVSRPFSASVPCNLVCWFSSSLWLPPSHISLLWA